MLNPDMQSQNRTGDQMKDSLLILYEGAARCMAALCLKNAHIVEQSIGTIDMQPAFMIIIFT